MTDLYAAAARALACLDLTNLDEDCDLAAVEDLCARARTPHGPIAAVCVWPEFVARARRDLARSGIRVAAVVNFPSGDGDLIEIREEVRSVVVDGADEIDLVVPWRALRAGRPQEIAATVLEVREVSGRALVKAILETGELADPTLIRRAAREALAGGADFLKTSTGKVPVNATPEAAAVLLEILASADRAAGLKVAGGVRTTADAAAYLGLCDQVMGAAWATPNRFRIGASSLLADLLATLDGGSPSRPPAGADAY
jgi:deoxyribose-phosphate aldolase